MCGKTRVTASLLVLALHLISREDGANFLDQSQSLVKQHGQLLLALKRFHKTNLRQVCFLTLLAVEVCPRAKILRNNDFRYVKFTYLKSLFNQELLKLVIIPVILVTLKYDSVLIL